jgi:hypothetical protein
VNGNFSWKETAPGIKEKVPFLLHEMKLIKNVDNLRLSLTVNGQMMQTVNGQMMQDGNRADFIIKIPFLISYVSRFMTLLPAILFPQEHREVHYDHSRSKK